ncbi:MAG: hypothetical protein CSA89_00755 [Bacteroidales bacterium]|nr:MAG: hypothetical protein CSA89_00755 [Bacteroidales bacterium]
MLQKSNELRELGVTKQKHNRGLDYVLHKLKDFKEQGNNFKSSSDILSFVEENSINFLTINSELINDKNKDKAIESAKYSFKWIQESNSNKDLWDSSVDNLLSSKQKELLTIMKSAIDNPALDLEATLKVFNEVKRRANKECSKEEQVAIMAALEIGTNSMIYWDKNINEWIRIVSLETKQLRGWFSWKDVGGADVKGTVTGTVTALVTGAGVPVSALGGGLGASAGQAAFQLWNHFVK